MKSAFFMSVTAMTLFAVLAMPAGLAAHAQHKPTLNHYKLIDLGTLGGPSSYILLDTEILNNNSKLAGWADTSISDPYPNFCFNPDCFVSHAFAWQHGVLTNLGVLPGGASSQASWLTSNGFLLGNSQNGEIDSLIPGFPERRGVVWKNGQIIDLGTFGGNESMAFGANSHGQAVGAALNTTPDQYSLLDLLYFFSSNGTQARAFVWQNGTKQDLGTLGTGNDALAFFINDAGQVAGFSYTNTVANITTGLPTFHPFLWDKRTGMRDLGSFGGTAVIQMGELNQKGEVVGSQTLPGDQAWHPFLWNGKTLLDLGTFGGNVGYGEWVNDAGSVVGQASYAGDQVYHAYLWKDGTMTDLGVLPGDIYSEAQTINSGGQIVGVSSNSAGEWRAVLWEKGQIVDLNVQVVPFTGVYINDRGEITAEALLQNGSSHAVLLIPCDGNHPGVQGCDYSPAK